MVGGASASLLLQRLSQGAHHPLLALVVVDELRSVHRAVVDPREHRSDGGHHLGGDVGDQSVAGVVRLVPVFLAADDEDFVLDGFLLLRLAGSG